MGIATQTFAALGSTSGSAYRTSGPAYSRILSSTSPPRSSFTGGTDTWRGIWEIDMAVLVAAGYVVGRAVTAMTLGLTVSTSSGSSNLKPGIINANFATAAATLFAAVDASNCQGAAQAKPATGARTITFDQTVCDIIPTLGGTDKRVLAIPLAVEASGGTFIVDSSVPQILSVTYEDADKKPLIKTFNNLNLRLPANTALVYDSTVSDSSKLLVEYRNG